MATADTHGVLISRIVALMHAANLTANQLAKRAGVSQTNLAGILRGVKSPTVRTLERLADALGVEVIDLFRTEPENLA